MSGSTFGNLFQITTWGESHGKALGVVIDGCPAGLALSEQDIQPYLDRRKPGQSALTTPRKEDDAVEILSGVFEGRTTGTPLSLLIPNTSQKSHDYSEIAHYYRPGHADYTYDSKYGFRDYRGGGRSSGRETAGRVAAGAVAAKLLAELGVTLCCYTRSIGPIQADLSSFDADAILKTPTYMPDLAASRQAEEYLAQCKKDHDSVGGVIECVVTGCPVGLGDPVFHKLDALLAQAILSIGAVKAFEVGDGIAAALAHGSAHNDAFCMDGAKVVKKTNHAGGILGGISDGSPIVLRAYIKPTPSIYKAQETVTKSGQPVTVQITGRHDPVIVPRAVVVVEAMTALVLADTLLSNMKSQMAHLKKFYSPSV